MYEYARTYGVNFSNWNLLTGDQSAIYELGVNGYLVPNQEDALAPGGFLHSEKLILIDQNKRIRGYYNGTDEEISQKLLKTLKNYSKNIRTIFNLNVFYPIFV